MCCTLYAGLRRPDLDMGGVFFAHTSFRKETINMNTANCPECDANLTVPPGAMQNELIACPDCGAELEIISLDPLILDLAPAVEEDWGE